MPHVRLSSPTSPYEVPTIKRYPAGDPRSKVERTNNRRAHSRAATSKPALIRTLQWDRIPCRVVDISAGGARIEVAAGVAIPERFKLLIPDDLFEAECEVRHTDEASAGLVFTSNQMEALAAYG